jgi:hypothetical protein
MVDFTDRLSMRRKCHFSIPYECSIGCVVMKYVTTKLTSENTPHFEYVHYVREAHRFSPNNPTYHYTREVELILSRRIGCCRPACGICHLKTDRKVDCFRMLLIAKYSA